MARNQEKAMSTLARWRAAQDLELKGPKATRPYLATECDDVGQAEKWRRQIISEITQGVAKIQNSALGEFKIRDLNDELNKKLREKRHWEDRIKELGGPDYFKIGPKMLDREGKGIPGNRGYRYFGAARDLPGVRELFEPVQQKKKKKTQSQLMKMVDPDYYGYVDEDDGVLIPLEQKQENKLLQNALKEWQANNDKMDTDGGIDYNNNNNGEIENIYSVASSEMWVGTNNDNNVAAMEEEGDKVGVNINNERDKESNRHGNTFISHVPVPSQEDVEQYLVKRQKNALLDRYVSQGLQKKEEESREMADLSVAQH